MAFGASAVEKEKVIPIEAATKSTVFRGCRRYIVGHPTSDRLMTNGLANMAVVPELIK